MGRAGISAIVFASVQLARGDDQPTLEKPMVRHLKLSEEFGVCGSKRPIGER